MSDIRFQSAGEARWFVAYLRYLAGQRPSEPTPGGHVYGVESDERKAKLRENARSLARDLTEHFTEPVGDHTRPGPTLSPLIAGMEKEGRL